MRHGSPIQDPGIFEARKVGATEKWKESSLFLATYLPVGLRIVVSERVTQVMPDGSYMIESGRGKAHVSWAGELLSPTSQAGLETYRFTSRGEILDAKCDPITNGWGVRDHNLEVPILPATPLKVGDIWTYDFKANPVIGQVAAIGSYKLMDSITVDGVELLEVGIEVKETTGAAPASSRGTVRLRKIDGSVYSSEIKLTNAAVPGIPGLATGTLRKAPVANP